MSLMPLQDTLQKFVSQAQHKVPEAQVWEVEAGVVGFVRSMCMHVLMLEVGNASYLLVISVCAGCTAARSSSVPSHNIMTPLGTGLLTR